MSLPTPAVLRPAAAEDHADQGWAPPAAGFAPVGGVSGTPHDPPGSVGQGLAPGPVPAPSSAPPPPPLPRVAAPAAASRRYRSLRHPEVLVWASVGALLASMAVLAVHTVVMHRSVGLLLDGDPMKLVEVDRLDRVADRLALLGVGVQVGAMALAGWWARQARRNIDLLHVRPPSWGPGMALAGWLIPLVSVVMPWLVVRDLWRASDPQPPPGDSTWAGRSASGLIALWGIVRMAGLFAGQAALLMAGGLLDSEDLEEWRDTRLVVTGAAVVLTLAHAALLLTLVRQITRRQRERAVRLERFGWLAPGTAGEA